MNDAKSMSTELEIMKRVKHENVVTMHEVFESSDRLWLILELTSGGNLRSLINQLHEYTEIMAAKHLAQILSGLQYLHSIGVGKHDNDNIDDALSVILVRRPYSTMYTNTLYSPLAC